MRRGLIVTTSALVLLVGACSSGESSGDVTLPEITLLPTTVDSTLPVFEEVEPGAEIASPTTSVTDTATGVTTTAPAVASPVTTAPPGGAPVAAPGATTTPVAGADPTATTATPPASGGDFELRIDGLGAVAFGAEPEGVISFVTSFFGAPTGDTGWIDPFEIGPCSGTQIRQVMWGVLTLEFGDASNVATGRPHFYAYNYGIEGQGSAVPVGLETPQGIGVGSTLADLLVAFPDAELRSADEFIAANFYINDNLRGLLTGLADSDTVTVVTGGLPCDG